MATDSNLPSTQPSLILQALVSTTAKFNAEVIAKKLMEPNPFFDSVAEEMEWRRWEGRGRWRRLMDWARRAAAPKKPEMKVGGVLRVRLPHDFTIKDTRGLV